MIYILALLMTPFWTLAEPMTKINCTYAFMNVQTAMSELNLHSDGTPESSILVSMGVGTKPSTFTVTPESLEAGEMVRIWISKEQPDGAIEMIVYSNKKSDGSQSKLINKNIPFGQEMSGPCTFGSF